jgi:hypothetical protein
MCLDAGFFLDHVDTAGAHSYGVGMRATFSLANSSGTYNKACLAKASDMQGESSL